MMDLDIGVVQDVEKRQKKRLLLDYLADNLKHHNWWAYRYFFCEFLALVNIIGKLLFFYLLKKLYNGSNCLNSILVLVSNVELSFFYIRRRMKNYEHVQLSILQSRKGI